jgi:hypothetical protein
MLEELRRARERRLTAARPVGQMQAVESGLRPVELPSGWDGRRRSGGRSPSAPVAGSSLREPGARESQATIAMPSAAGRERPVWRKLVRRVAVRHGRSQAVLLLALRLDRGEASRAGVPAGRGRERGGLHFSWVEVAGLDSSVARARATLEDHREGGAGLARPEVVHVDVHLPTPCRSFAAPHRPCSSSFEGSWRHGGRVCPRPRQGSGHSRREERRARRRGACDAALRLPRAWSAAYCRSPRERASARPRRSPHTLPTTVASAEFPLGIGTCAQAARLRAPCGAPASRTRGTSQPHA